VTITPAQAHALAYVRDYSKNRKDEASATIAHILKMSDIAPNVFADVLSKVKSTLRVAFHFHPDRLDPNMKNVAEALLESGIYKSQFETLLSSGSVSAHAGGARDLWEERLFNGAYQKKGVDNSQRPKYGALDFIGHSDGPSPRFGSCYFLLKPEVTRRCTLTYLDSYLDPKQKGTLEEFDDIIAAVLSDSFSDKIIFGEQLRPARLVQRLQEALGEPFIERFLLPPSRILDHYIEAQVHGPVLLKDDVEYLVADPSFQGTAIGNTIKDLCEKFEITLHWHSGFVLKTNEVPCDFRGPSMPSLARRVAPDGMLNVKRIGDAASSLRRNPSDWSDRGSEKDVLQELKLLWHVLLRYGK
jgi:hypothetical protein